MSATQKNLNLAGPLIYSLTIDLNLESLKRSQYKFLKENLALIAFSLNRPWVRFSLVVAKSVCVFACLRVPRPIQSSSCNVHYKAEGLKRLWHKV